MKRSQILILTLVLLIVAAIVFVLFLNQKAKDTPTEAPTATIEPTAEPTAEPTETAGQEEGKNFFASLELTYLNGDPFDASVFDGKPILLNIWATWCSPCVSEMPHLNELAAVYADRLNIIGLHSEGLTITEAGEGELVPNEEVNQAALEMAENLALTFPLVNPDTSLFILMNNPDYGLQVSVLPTTWLIDGDGFIRGILTSSRDKEGWIQVIDEFLTKLQEEADEGTEV